IIDRTAAFGDLAPIIVRTLGLVAAWGLFFGAYLTISVLMSLATANGRSASEMARNFAFTLVPIAIGYHVAHYLAFLLIQGQYIVPLVSDPFGLGWNLFGTAGYRVDIAMVGPRFSWYTAVTAILVGHVIAVCLAHARAMRVLGARAAALRCEVPLTALMVGYTFITLTLLPDPLLD